MSATCAIHIYVKESVSFIDQGCCVGAEARLSVPRLLSVMGDSADAREEWRTGWQGVPLQALLPWAAQMLSLLSQAEGDALLPTLKVCHLPSSPTEHIFWESLGSERAPLRWSFLAESQGSLATLLSFLPRLFCSLIVVFLIGTCSRACTLVKICAASAKGQRQLSSAVMC